MTKRRDQARLGLASTYFGSVVLLWCGTAYWLLRRHGALGRTKEWLITPHPRIWPSSVFSLPLAVLALFGGLALLSAYDRYARSKTPRDRANSVTLCVIALTLLSFLWPWSMLGPLGGSTLIESTYSDISNQYFSTAYSISNVRDFTRTYADRQQRVRSRLLAHVATHPPGAVLLYYGAIHVFNNVPAIQRVCTALLESQTHASVTAVDADADHLRRVATRSGGQVADYPAFGPAAAAAAAWCAILMAVAAALTIPAVYLLAAGAPWQAGDDAGQRHARGMIATALCALAPSLNLFTYTVDAVIACCAAWTLVLATRRLGGGGQGWMVASGVLLALTTFISFGALATGIIVLLAIAIQACGSAGSLASRGVAAVRDALALVVGFIAGWMGLCLLFPMQPLRIFSLAMHAHHVATVQYRFYGTWVWLNVLTFALFLGWPATIAAIGGMSRSLAAARRPDRAGAGEYGNHLELAGVIGISTCVTMLLLTLSGNVLGEVERLWLFLVPGFCVLASTAVAEAATRRSARLVTMGWVLLLLLQAAQTLLMAATLSPLVQPA